MEALTMRHPLPQTNPEAAVPAQVNPLVAPQESRDLVAKYGAVLLQDFVYGTADTFISLLLELYIDGMAKLLESANYSTEAIAEGLKCLYVRLTCSPIIPLIAVTLCQAIHTQSPFSCEDELLSHFYVAMMLSMNVYECEFVLRAREYHCKLHGGDCVHRSRLYRYAFDLFADLEQFDEVENRLLKVAQNLLPMTPERLEEFVYVKLIPAHFKFDRRLSAVSLCMQQRLFRML